MNKNKSLRVATSLMLVASTAAVAAAPVQTSAATKNPILKSKFTDVKKGDYFHDAVVTLTDEQVLNGYGDQTFRPNVPTTRGHIAIVLTRVLNLQATQYVNIQDMPTTHDTYDYAAAAIIHGLMSTDQYNNFNPKSELSRYEYAEILTRAYNLKPTYKKKHKFKNVPEQYKIAVQTVFDHGLMQGFSTTDFGGYENITRGQMAVTLVNARSLSKEAKPSEPVFKGQQTTEIISYNTKTYKVETTDGEYKISQKLRPLFTNSNKAILQNAIINGEFAGDELVAIQDLELVQSYYASNQTIASLKPNLIAAASPFNASNPFANAQTVANTSMAVLDLGGITIAGKIIIKVNSVSIRNGSASQIVVTDEADTALYLFNVQVKDLIVQDGYYRDFILQLENSTANRIQIDRDDVFLKSNKKLAHLILSDNVYLIELQSPVGLVEIMKDGYATLVGLISIDRLLIADEADVHIGSSGYVKTAEILARGGEISFATNLRLGHVVLPAGATNYRDYLNFYGDLKTVIGKVTLPGSNQNLFHDQIQLPSKEEIQREELFAKLVDKVTAEGSRNQFSFISSINSYSAGMREYPVNMSFVVTSGLTQLNGTDIVPTTVTFRGKSSTQNFTVAQLRSGFSLNSVLGSMTLKDLAPNAANRVNIEFKTPYPLTVRGALSINNQSKGVAEAALNGQYNEDIKTLINTLTTQSVPGGVQINKRYGAISDEFNNVSEDVKIQLTQLRNPTNDSQAIPFKLTYAYNGQDKSATFTNITLAQLKSGVSLYTLIGMADKKMSKDDARKIETWTVQFTETVDADFKVQALINGSEMKSSTFKINFDRPVAKAINSLTASKNVQQVVTLSKRYNKLDDTMYNKSNDIKMTLTGATVPTDTSKTVPFVVKYKLGNGTFTTKEITNQTAANLMSGVYLYSLLGLNIPLGANLSEQSETIEVEFKGAIKGTLKFDAIINGAVETSDTASIDVKEAVLPSVKSLDVTPTNRGFKVVQTFNPISKDAEGRKADLKLKLTSVTKPTKDEDKVLFKIKYKYNNGTEKIINVTDQTVAKLKTGVSLYTLAKESAPTLTQAHSDAIVSFEIEFDEEMTGTFQVTSEVANETSIIKSQTVDYKGLAIESIKAEKTLKGLNIEQKYANPITDNYFDKNSDIALRMVTTEMSNATEIPLTIWYTDSTGNRTGPVTKTVKVSELTATSGKSLYELVGKSPIPKLTSDLDEKAEKFEIEFGGDVSGKFRVLSFVDSEKVRETDLFDISFKNPFVSYFTKEAITDYSFILSRQFANFADTAINTKMDVKLKLATTQTYAADEKVNLLIKYQLGSGTLSEKEVPVEVKKLTAGISLYELIEQSNFKLAEELKGKEEKWEVSFKELVDGQLKVEAFQADKLIDAVSLDGSKFNLYGFKSFEAAFNNEILKVTTGFGQPVGIVTDQTVDAFFKVVNGFENEDPNREISFKIGFNDTDMDKATEVNATVEDLLKGVNLSDLLKLAHKPTLASHNNGRTDNWYISFDDAYFDPIDADISLVVNEANASTQQQVVKTVRVRLINNKATILRNLVETFEVTYNGTSKPNEFSTELKLKDASNIGATLGELPVDARLKITSEDALKQDKYSVTISFGDQELTPVDVDKGDLISGIKLSKLISNSQPKLKDHTTESTKWTFKVDSTNATEDETVSGVIQLLFGDYPVKTEKLENFVIKKTGSNQ